MFSFILKYRHKQSRPAFFSTWTKSEIDWSTMAVFVGPNRQVVEKAIYGRAADLMETNPDNEYRVEPILITETVGV